MSKKSCTILYNEFTMKIGHDFGHWKHDILKSDRKKRKGKGEKESKHGTFAV